MLRIVRRHQRGCKFTSESDRRCQCPFHLRGVDRVGNPVKESLGTRNWAVASEMLHEREAGVKQKEAPPVTVADAIKAYRQFKEAKSADTRRKIKLLTERLKVFLEKRSIFNIDQVKLGDLSAFRAGWTGADTTRHRDQEILRSFFNYCVDADYITKNPAKLLDAVSVGRAKTDPFSEAEQIAIFDALPHFPDEYGRRGTDIARQTKAFVLVLRYTGMSIGDVTLLEQSAVTGRRIMTFRKKTDELVHASVPQFVVDELWAAPHDSEKYFFWSGVGKIHTRTSKWGNRLRKLFTLAGVPDATPHQFRHTLARDFLVKGGSMVELAELLGNSPEICVKHYSKWDQQRQDRLEQNLDELRENDPITKRLSSLASAHKPDGTPIPAPSASDTAA
jgi:integrase